MAAQRFDGCVGLILDVDGRRQDVCLIHVPGNELLASDVAEGIRSFPTAEEVERAVAFFRASSSPCRPMAELPDAAAYPGAIIRNTSTGERLRSDGTQWVATERKALKLVWLQPWLRSPRIPTPPPAAPAPDDDRALSNVAERLGLMKTRIAGRHDPAIRRVLDDGGLDGPFDGEFTELVVIGEEEGVPVGFAAGRCAVVDEDEATSQWVPVLEHVAIRAVAAPRDGVCRAPGEGGPGLTQRSVPREAVHKGDTPSLGLIRQVRIV